MASRERAGKPNSRSSTVECAVDAPRLTGLPYGNDPKSLTNAIRSAFDYDNEVAYPAIVVKESQACSPAARLTDTIVSPAPLWACLSPSFHHARRRF